MASKSPRVTITANGPYLVEGGVPLARRHIVTGAEGQAYELRGRVALCRCGESKNKPFCDGTHAAIGFDCQA